MAAVYLAIDRKHDRHVAIKVLSTEAGAAGAVERFEREIHVLARLQHPNILPVFDSGIAGGRLWYAMPYVQGESLRNKIERDGAMNVSSAITLLCSLADALSYAHAEGIIHRDIKPENILLSHGIPLIADFGIAAALDAITSSRLTETGMAIGTPQYMSPEQAVAEGTVDGRSDIYSLGCVGFEMLAGKPPFEGASIQAIIARLVATSSPSISQIRSDVSPALDAVIAKAIAREPSDRWQTGSAFSEALSQARHGNVLSESRGKTNQRRWLRAGIVGAAIVIAGGTVAVVLNASKEIRKPQVIQRHVPNSEATAAYRRGIARIQQRTQRTLLEGIAFIDQAIRIDSLYALAWAGKARAYAWAQLWDYEIPGVPSDSLLSRELAASEKALDLDSLDPEIWLVNANAVRDVDPTRRDVMLAALRRAHALDSVNSPVLIALALSHQDAGNIDSAGFYFRKAMNLGYRDTGAAGYANYFYWRRQYDSAKVWSDSAIARTPRNPYARELAGATDLMLGKLETAENNYQAAMRLDEGPTRVRGMGGLAEVAAARGDRKSAMKLIADAEKLTDPSKPSDHAAIALASAYAAVGRNGAAIHWLEKYEPRGDLHFQLHLKRDPPLDPLRRDSRFAALLTR